MEASNMKTKHKNIFLTSLDETKNRLDVENNSYTCQFNGKEVRINISMFKPEKDYDMEDED